MSEVFPVEWNRPEDKEKVIRLLIDLPIGWRAKKMALYEWCKLYGVVMLARDVERVTGRPAGEI